MTPSTREFLQGIIDNIADPVFTLEYLFIFGEAPPPPFPLCSADLGCGPDPTPDALDCDAYPPCP